MPNPILDGNQDDACSFCGKRRLEVRQLLRAGDQRYGRLSVPARFVYICDFCVQQARTTMDQGHRL